MYRLFAMFALCIAACDACVMYACVMYCLPAVLMLSLEISAHTLPAVFWR